MEKSVKIEVGNSCYWHKKVSDGRFVLHRDNGPAIIHRWKETDKEEYWLNGQLCKINGIKIKTQEEFEKYKKLLILL